jgi:hypothetical protein
MSDPGPKVSDSLLPDEPGTASSGKGTTMDPIKADARRRLPFTNGNMPLRRRSRRPGRYAGYSVNSAGQVIVDMSKILGNKDALEMARRMQEVGRETLTKTDPDS